MFPGIDVRLMTLKMNMALPFYREYVMSYVLLSPPSVFQIWLLCFAIGSSRGMSQG